MKIVVRKSAWNTKQTNKKTQNKIAKTCQRCLYPPPSGLVFEGGGIMRNLQKNIMKKRK